MGSFAMFIETNYFKKLKKGDFMTMSKIRTAVGQSMGGRLEYTPRRKKKIREKAKKEAQYAKRNCGPCRSSHPPKEVLNEMLKKYGLHA